MSDMRHVVSIYEAKTQFSKLVDLVLKGDEVVVTNRGKEVVELRPVEPRKKVIVGLYKGILPDWNPMDMDEEFAASFDSDKDDDLIR